MKKLIAVVLFAAFCLMPIAFGENPEAAESGSLVAFPGAEGGGMYTTGARGSSSPTIYHVTNLDDSGSGSLRDAVSQANRVIVFDVAGTINLTTPLNLSRKNLTILGQTAPGDGICVSGAPTVIRADNIIMRYLRFRMGVYDEENLKYDGDALGGTNNTENLIVDHCSMSWSTDECASFYAIKDSTIQWCIITEPLNRSIHDEGLGIEEHGFGGIMGGVNVSYHHNLVSSAKDRFPLVGTSETVSSYEGGNDTDGLLDIRNNVFYNWKGNSSHGGQNGMRVNLVNNYYKEGPASKALNRFYRMFSGNKGGKPNWGPDIAIGGNYYESRSGSDVAASINNDNKVGVETYTAEIYNIEDYNEGLIGTSTNHTQYIHDYPMGTHTAQEAYELVLEHAGASMSRDAVDERAVRNARTGTAEMGKNGIIDLEHLRAMPSITYSGTKAQDSDNDGIPDSYEDEHGLDKNNASDALEKAESGYFNIEEYANWLVADNELPIPPTATLDPNQPIPEPTPTLDPTPLPKQNIYVDYIANGAIEIDENMTKSVTWSGNSYRKEIDGAKTFYINGSDGSDGTITMFDPTTTTFTHDGKTGARGENNPKNINPPFSESNQPTGSVFMLKPAIDGKVTAKFYINGGKNFNIYDNTNERYIEQKFTIPKADFCDFTFDCTTDQEFYAWADYSKAGLQSVTVTGGFSARPGDTVTVNTIPDSGYRANGIYTVPETETEQVSENRFAFTMPDSDVIVGAEFVDDNLPSPRTGVYYEGEPMLVGDTVRAKIVNTDDESGAWFIAAAYKDDIMLEAKIITVPIGETIVTDENNMRLADDYSNDSEIDVKFYLWSAGSLTPYTNI